MSKPLAPESIPLHLPCVREGRTTYPYVGGITRAGVEVLHKSSHQHLPLCWRELIQGGARMFGKSPREFLDFLAEVVADDASPSSAQSGPPSFEHRPQGSQHPF